MDFGAKYDITGGLRSRSNAVTYLPAKRLRDCWVPRACAVCPASLAVKVAQRDVSVVRVTRGGAVSEVFQPGSSISRCSPSLVLGTCFTLFDPRVPPPASPQATKSDTRLSGARVVKVHPNIPDFNLLWTGIHPKPHLLRAMTPYQRVNHFPRSYELTRKDRLYKNIEKMQHLKGLKNFDFIPQTFVMPTDIRELCSAHYRQRGPWIVKPSLVVAKYIDNPLLVDGHKCDLRLYVAVTSYDPLRIYLYEEGLVRFATVKYDTSGKHLWNPCMHLCNYSINKYHSDYVKSEDPEAEDVGHKWTLSALLRHLRAQGHDTAQLMHRIEELVVKSVLASAPPIVAACKLFVPYPNNCFELYGFDILVDSAFKPWLLEVNLSPSLGCDSPLDVRVKSAMLADLLTLVGIPAVDPMLRRANEGHRTSPAQDLLRKLNSCRRVQSADTLPRSNKPTSSRLSASSPSLTAEESRLVRTSRAEYERRGGFVRIFPSVESWRRYGSFLDPTTGVPSTASPLGTLPLVGPAHNLNLLLQRQLFPEQRDATAAKPDRLGRYERALLRGHRAAFLLDGDKGVGLESAEDAQQVSALKEQVRQSLEDGSRLSQNQSRRAFGLYLATILRRLTGPNPASNEAHAELILRFLQRASYNLRTPYFVKVPSRKLAGKDRVAVIAKQLNDFIYLYNRETDLFAEQTEGPEHVPGQLFQRFLAVANEPELEEVLTLQTRLYKCAHLYLGRCGPPVTDLRTVGLLRSLPDLTNAADCECVRRGACRPSLPRLVRKPPSTPTRNLSQCKSRSLDSTPSLDEEHRAVDVQVEPVASPANKPATVVISRPNLTSSRSCTFRRQASSEDSRSTPENVPVTTMRKSASLQEASFKKARTKTNEDDMNFLNTEPQTVVSNNKSKLDRGRDKGIGVRAERGIKPKISNTVTKNPHRRSLSGDSARASETSPPRTGVTTTRVTDRHPIGHRSLPRLAGAFRNREEEEAAVRRLLQPLRATLQSSAAK
ncbi:hypothetical protein B566_EDAN015974 [Ephemera danica]|nr:hypothetical protein B566_EDAN015974 [Ephemera danica]